MKKIFFIIILSVSLPEIIMAQAIGLWPRVLSKPKQSWCSFDNKKVVDVRPSTCLLESGCNYLYPVINEDFDYPYDLPNKWRFNYGYTLDDNNRGTTWHGKPFIDQSGNLTNHNIKISNGIITFLNIQEEISGDKNYDGVLENFKFTSGMIRSLSDFRTGIFEARIKLPTANKMWPAFWL